MSGLLRSEKKRRRRRRRRRRKKSSQLWNWVSSKRLEGSVLQGPASPSESWVLPATSSRGF
jgi:hypothetical protein